MSKKYFLPISPEELESMDMVCEYLQAEKANFEAQAEPSPDHIWTHVKKLNDAVDRLIGVTK